MATRQNEYWLLDLDRCLVDTALLADIFFEVSEPIIGISRSQIKAAKAEVEQTGGSFDAIKYIERELGSQGRHDALDLAEAKFIEIASLRDVKLGGADKLIASLKRLGIDHGIFTYGGERWQRMKLAASGLDKLPVLITGNPNKANIISSWLSADGAYNPPVELAMGGSSYDSIVLVDDKASSFSGLPSGARGYHVYSEKDSLPSQRGEVPENVVTVENLDLIDIA